MGEIDLKNSGLILTFTDGLTDLRNMSGDYFEDDQIEAVIAQNGCDSAKEFNEKLLKAMNTFRGENSFPDDIAVLTCRFET